MNPPTELPTARLYPRHNLRSHFDDAQLALLAESLKADGMFAPILVRAIDDIRFEIIDGERRWRAAKLAGIAIVPVKVCEVDDTKAALMHFIMFLQRTDLTPLEQARGFQSMLAEKKPDGSPVFTVNSLARELKIPEQAIWRSIRSLNTPAAVQSAVEAGEMSLFAAAMIGAIPHKSARESAAKCLLRFNCEGGNPLRKGTPATMAQAQEYIQKNVYRDLRQATFEQETKFAEVAPPPGLVLPAKSIPAEDFNAGSCSQCPQRSGNMPEAKDAPSYLCTNPKCFAVKSEMAWRKKAAANYKGEEILSFAESAEIFPPYLPDGTMSAAAANEWADLAGKPIGFVKAEILPSKIPKWREIVGDSARNITRARAQNGSVHQLIPISAALECAKSHPEFAEMFGKSKKVAGFQRPDAAWDEKKEKTGSLTREPTALAILREIIAAWDMEDASAPSEQRGDYYLRPLIDRARLLLK